MSAASVLPVCRRSWKCRPGTPMVRTTSTQRVSLLKPAPAQRAALDPGEHERVVVVLRVLRKVRGQVGDDPRWDAHRPPTGTGLGRTEQHLPVVLLRIGEPHTHGAGGDVDVTVPEHRHLTPSQACEGGKQDELPEAIIAGGVRTPVLCQVPQHPKCSGPRGEGAGEAPHRAVDRPVAQAVLTRVELANVADRTNTHTPRQLEHLFHPSEPDVRPPARSRLLGHGRDPER